MKNPFDSSSENFLTALRKKREAPPLPHGFDERFWAKFDKKHTHPSRRAYSFWIQRVGAPALVLLLFVFWNFNQEVSSPFRDDEIIIVDPEVGAEDMDIAMHLDILDSADEEVWNNLFEGVENDQG